MVDADLEGPLLDVGTYLFSLVLVGFLVATLLTVSSVVLTLLHCQHMGCPVLWRSAAGVLIGAAALIFCTFAGLAATLAASSFRVCLRASWKNLSPP
jgi:Rieske Fe-S protein